MNWRKIDKIVKWLVAVICASICYMVIRLTIICYDDNDLWNYLQNSKFFQIESELFIALAVLICYLIIRKLFIMRQKHAETKRYKELREQMTDLYYKHEWESLKAIYDTSGLPRITIDMLFLETLRSRGKIDKTIFKYSLTWEESDNKIAEWIMAIIIRDAYWYLIDANKLLNK